MSRSLRLIFCLALVLIAPAIVLASTATTGCDVPAASLAAADGSDLVTGLPTTVFAITTSNGFSCPAAFQTANFCSQCWTAYRQCSGGDCYACTETCLARIGCWIP